MPTCPTIPLMSRECHGFIRNPAYTGDDDQPLLLHCHHQATRLIVVGDASESRTLRLCGPCAQLERRAAERIGCRIISDQPIPFNGMTPADTPHGELGESGL